MRKVGDEVRERAGAMSCKAIEDVRGKGFCSEKNGETSEDFEQKNGKYITYILCKAFWLLG